MIEAIKSKMELNNNLLNKALDRLSEKLMLGNFEEIAELLDNYGISVYDDKNKRYKLTSEILDELSEKLAFNAEKVKNDIVQWIRDWFAENGPECSAVIGISGGKDSSVVAALCVEALGKERVFGVLMPNTHQSDIRDSYDLVEHLDINFMTVDIGLSVDSLLCGISYPKNGKGAMISDQTRVNLPPRIRMATLYAVSQSINGRVACTDNLSEAYIGYSTRWGDNVGDFCPLANLTSEEVVAVGDALGLPYELTHKVPSDGLCGKTDEDRFGFTYEALNKYIRTGICEDKEVKAKIDSMHQKNLFKLNPIPRFPY